MAAPAHQNTVVLPLTLPRDGSGIDPTLQHFIHEWGLLDTQIGRVRRGDGWQRLWDMQAELIQSRAWQEAAGVGAWGVAVDEDMKTVVLDKKPRFRNGELIDARLIPMLNQLGLQKFAISQAEKTRGWHRLEEAQEALHKRDVSEAAAVAAAPKNPHAYPVSVAAARAEHALKRAESAAAAAALTNPALHNAATRLAKQETERYPLLVVSRRMQRLQVQQDALVSFYLKHKGDLEWPCGPTEDDSNANAKERNLWDLRDNGKGLIGVYAKQPVKHQTSLQCPGIVITPKLYNEFDSEFYCPTALPIPIAGKKYVLCGFPCRVGGIINHANEEQETTGIITYRAELQKLKKNSIVQSRSVCITVTKGLRENHELLVNYNVDVVGTNAARAANDVFAEEAKKPRSCDKCARRTLSIPSAENFRDCEEEGCWFGRHIGCFSDYDQENAKNEEIQFLCLDHEAQTFKRRYDDAVRMLYDKYPEPIEEGDNPVKLNASAHLEKLQAQQLALEAYAEAAEFDRWSHVSPSQWVKENFEIRQSVEAPMTLGVFATKDIEDPRCILAVAGRAVAKTFRIPYNGLVLLEKEADALLEALNCPTRVAFTRTHDLIGNPADIGPMINSVDTNGLTKLPAGKVGLPMNRKVNCEFGSPDDGEPGEMKVFVQIVDRIPKGAELLLDYGQEFWTRAKRQNLQACEICQFTFTSDVPRELTQVQCTHGKNCHNVAHLNCTHSLGWLCSLHAPPKPRSVIELLSDDDGPSAAAAPPLRQPAPTEAASAAPAAAAANNNEYEKPHPMQIDGEAGTGNRARLARLHISHRK
jgi:hypothetical protein